MLQHKTYNNPTQVAWANGQGGKQGETAVYKFLTDYCHIPADAIADVSLSPYYQARDVDYTMDYHGYRYCLEVKQDNTTWHSPNLIIETIANIYKAKDGWGYTTQADYIYIYRPNFARLYILRAAAVKRYLIDKLPTLQLCYQQTGNYRSQAAIIPIKSLIDSDVITQIIDLTNYKYIYIKH
jgi:hypothetical protein